MSALFFALEELRSYCGAIGTEMVDVLVADIVSDIDDSNDDDDVVAVVIEVVVDEPLFIRLPHVYTG